MVPKKSDNKKKKLDSISFSLEFNNRGNAPKRNTDKEGSNGMFRKSLQRIGFDFTTLMLLIKQYMNEIGSAAEYTKRTNVLNLIPFIGELKELEKKKTNEEQELGTAIFEMNFVDEKGKPVSEKIESKVYEEEHIDKFIEFQNKHDIALDILNETGVQQIVNSYESIIGDILEWQLYNKPDNSLNKQHLSYKDILEFNSLEEAKKKVVDDHKEKFLKNKSAKDQLKYFKDEFNIDIASLFPELNKFKELILRRHCIVHAGGIATSEYLSKTRGIQGVESSEIKLGHKIKTDSSYVVNSWMVVYALGVILFHQVGQNFARHKKDKELEEEFDFILISATFDAIKNKAYKGAEYILRYANGIKLSGDSAKYHVILNLAQSKLWQGKKDKCHEILDEHDWTCLSPKMQIAVAALKNDEDMFRKLLPLVSAQNELRIEHFLEWPIFRLIRKNEGYENWLEKEFGKKTNEFFELIPETMFDFKGENIEKIKSLLETDS